MLAESYVFHAKALNSFESGSRGGEEVYKIFLNILSQYDEKLATELHDERSIKPFSCSTIKSFKKPKEGKIAFEKNEKFYFTVNLLSEKIKESFLKAIYKLYDNANGILNLDNNKIKINKVKFSKTFNLEEIKDKLKNENFSKICVEFLSPCCLKRSEVVYPFPEPQIVLKSILKRWDRFVGIGFGLESDIFLDIMVERYKLKTEILAFKKFKLIGFVGEVCYNLRKIAKEDRVKIALLFEYGTYSGVGYKVSMGMGKIDIKGYY